MIKLTTIIDPRHYSRLREMTVHRHANWERDTVEISLKHKPSGMTSRGVEVSRADVVNYEVFLSDIVSNLARELEVEVQVYERMESQ